MRSGFTTLTCANRNSALDFFLKIVSHETLISSKFEHISPLNFAGRLRNTSIDPIIQSIKDYLASLDNTVENT